MQIIQVISNFAKWVNITSSGVLLANGVFTFALLATISTVSFAESDNSNHQYESQASQSNGSLLKCKELKAEDSTNIAMVNQLLIQKKPYAALAFIDSFDIAAPQLELLKANSLRQIGRDAEAEALYHTLKSSCVGAFVYQGLGLIHNQRGHYQESVNYLKIATKLAPINSTIRSDYGFSLMSIGDYKMSLNEYLTAIELDDRNLLAKYNLVALLYKNNQIDKASQFAKRYGLSDIEINKIRQDLVLQQDAHLIKNHSKSLKDHESNQAIKSSDVELHAVNLGEVHKVNDFEVVNKANNRLSDSTTKTDVNKETVCLGASDVCTGILTMKLEGNIHE